jgi:hypothetical protein
MIHSFKPLPFKYKPGDVAMLTFQKAEFDRQAGMNQ